MPVRFNGSGDGVRFGTTSKPANAFTIVFWQKVITANDSTSRTIFFAERDASPYGAIRLFTGGTNDNQVTGFEGSSQSLSPQPDETNWYMWALTSSGTGAASVNGYAWKVGDPDGTYSTASSTNTTTDALGSALWGLGDYGGEYRDAEYAFVKIWDTALSLSELQAERVQGKPVKTANVNRYHRLADNADTSDGNGGGLVLTFNGSVATGGDEPTFWEVPTPQFFQYDWRHQYHARR